MVGSEIILSREKTASQAEQAQTNGFSNKGCGDQGWHGDSFPQARSEC